MNMARSAGEVLAEHTTLELECIDRMYLNVYVPLLQAGAGAAWFFRKVRGNPVPSSALMAPMTNRFVAGLKRFAVDHDIDLVRFGRHERKDDRTRAYLRDFQGDEGVLYMGVAQEKARVVRTERRVDPLGGAYPWLVSSTAMVNHYYVYIVDEDFGPLFVKFCSYFPYNAKLCINGHEYLKRRLRLRGLIERIPRTRRYRVTEDGVRTALCYHRTHARVMKPAMAISFDPTPHPARLRRALDAFDHEVDRLWEGRQLAA